MMSNKIAILKKATFISVTCIITIMLSGCTPMYLEHIKVDISVLNSDWIMYTVFAIWTVSIVGLFASLYAQSPTLVREHKQEVEIDGELHVIRDKSKDEYEDSGLTVKEGNALGSRVVGWCVYLFALYWVLKYCKHLLPSMNLLWIVIIGIIFLGICYFVDKYIYKLWKYVLYACWVLSGIDLITLIILWMYNTSI